MELTTANATAARDGGLERAGVRLLTVLFMLSIPVSGEGGFSIRARRGLYGMGDLLPLASGPVCHVAFGRLSGGPPPRPAPAGDDGLRALAAAGDAEQEAGPGALA